ncbi:efflux RND transporter periplasmic adaptor subunit [Paenibacillus contaminans]|uniref:Multidrug resistance protein MdtA-like barrel-sandwich hybrid domain-containing protein n=1 Tax=Paenibacillus contaminans TaxID=450362 RepID=A0A329M537_9BACL|nr:biotin/lipoyl-binding protein [Paenibacillus contaminans]RAV14848.1 hypothetical protein DQG23_30935 [Paenibacillus contaminans]
MRKKTIGVIAGLFLSALLLLTFFSNTMLALTLPKVVTEKPRKAALQQKIEGAGTIVPQEEIELKSPSGQKAAGIHVKEGDAVKRGQKLITFDNKETQRQLQDEQSRLQQQKLSQEKLKESFIKAQQSGEENAIREAKRSLESHDIDMAVQERKIQSLNEKMAEQRQLAAPFDGIVTQVAAGEGQAASQGQTLIKMMNTAKGFKLDIQIPEEGAALFKKGDKAPVQVETEGGAGKQLEGQLIGIEAVEQSGGGGGLQIGAAGAPKDREMKEAGPNKRLVFSLQDPGLRGGESAKLVMTKQIGKEELLVPKGAIKEDAGGSYVFTITEKKGPLGNVLTVRKAYVTKGSSSENETAVVRGLTPTDSFITESSEPLQEGNRIRLQ